MPRTLQALTRGLAERGTQPALTQLERTGKRDWTCGELAEEASRLAAGLASHGVEPGRRVILFAPSSPRWIIACLAVLEIGAVPVPVDSQATGEDLEEILRRSGARWAFTHTGLARRVRKGDAGDELRLVLMDAEPGAEDAYEGLLEAPVERAATVDPSQEAVLFFTSGTSGPPKGVPLTHANLLWNLEAILGQGIIEPSDRLLLPLPLHHVYPFCVGLLAALVLEVPLILPHSLTGPQLARALSEGEASVILGIPRLYAALFDAIEQRVGTLGRAAGAAFQALLRLSIRLRQRTGLRTLSHVLAPLRRRLGPRLRLLVSGGAALSPELACRLEGLGWQVATGYGLTETSPILTVNPPGARRFASAGKPLPGLELRTAPVEDGSGDEVQAKGPSVFAGYLDLPDKTASAFTSDGWLRTGDLGHLDADGWLHLSGRASSMILLAGGENIDPETVEERIGGCASVREAGVLEHEGRLAAVVVPERGVARELAGPELQERLQEEVAVASREAPTHQRPSRVLVSTKPLPRTRLGKLRRHRLAERVRSGALGAGEAKAEAGLARPEDLAPEDRQLLDDATARQVWDWLGTRFEGQRIDPETDLRIDLEVDSLEWVDLTLDLQERVGLLLEEEAIERIETVRDLLRESAAASPAETEGASLEERLKDPEAALDADRRHWLDPPNPAYRALAALGYGLAGWVMRGIFRLRVSGVEHLPDAGPCVLAPNHRSSLDPLTIAAVLSRRQRRMTCWAGSTVLFFDRPWVRPLSRVFRILPVDAGENPISGLTLGAAALERGCVLVWFPEGHRSDDGALQPFRSGIGKLVQHRDLSVVPLRIEGTREALAPGTLRLRWHPISLRVGEPATPQALEQAGEGDTPAERIANALHERVRALEAEAL